MQVTDSDAGNVAATVHDYTISLNYVMERFNAEGIGRTKRRLAELCQKGTLEGKKFKTTHGDTWFVTPASLDAAIQQIKTEERLAAAAGDGRMEPAGAGAGQHKPAAEMIATVMSKDSSSTSSDHSAAADEPAIDPATAGASMPQPAGARSRPVPSEQGSAKDFSGIDIFSHPYDRRPRLSRPHRRADR